MRVFRGLFYALAVLGLLLSSQVNADDFSFTGNLTHDDDVALFEFSLSATATVTLRTWSYAGGTNADGDIIPSGGFDPILALFDSTGLLIGENDDGTGVPSDPDTGSAYDTLLEVVDLPAGTYTVSVAQYSNFAIGPNLSDGFEGSGQTNFDGRTSFWAFDVQGADAAVGPPPTAPATPVPLLSTWALILLVSLVGLIGIRAGTRRQVINN